MKNTLLAVRLEKELLEGAKKVAPEGNVSMWIRMLIRKEIEKYDKEG